MWPALPPLLALVVAVPVASPLSAQGSPGLESGRGAVDRCATNLHGLGICQSVFQLCPFGPGCDASTPCPDGTVCTIGSSCASTLGGVCFVPFTDGACSNPGTAAGGYESCEPVLFHEDFKPPAVAAPEGEPPPDLHQMTVSLICGSGGFLFENESCAATAGASSPLETARWGVALNCASYGLASHRVMATTGAVDISGCDGAELDFDYLIALEQGARFDRTFVTVSVDGGLAEVIATNQVGSAPAFTSSFVSCAGTVLPVGTLIQDGAWHHYRAGIGTGTTVEVAFWAETRNNENNANQGWFFDDVRIDCGVRIFADSFEGANRLRWTRSVPPSPPSVVDTPGVCGNYFECAGPGADCLNFNVSGGGTRCLSDFSCFNTPCPGGVGDCAAGELCVVDSCCLMAVCAPAVCEPNGAVFAPTGATTGASRR